MAQGTLVYNALIIPLSAASAPPRPTPGPTPPGGGGAPPVVDNTLPGDIPIPSHPIFYPLPPGAPVDPAYGIPETGRPIIDNTLPGSQPGIDNTLPGNGGWLPVYIDNTLPGPGSAGGERPDNTLPVPPPTEEEKAKVVWKCAWTPTTGWVSFAIVVPGGEHVTPSRGGRTAAKK